jgi:hypothetical protein
LDCKPNDSQECSGGNSTEGKKKKEGTWMERKPPRKAPTSGDRSELGSSGGVKRPHSDSSTPIMERQHFKKTRRAVAQTGSYKEAVVGIKMAVIDKQHPEVKLDQTQADMIQAKLEAAVHTHPVEETPLQFLNSKFMQGYCGSPVLMNILRLGLCEQLVNLGSSGREWS